MPSNSVPGSRLLLETDRLMRPIAHFSHAARVANTVHVGAIAGTDALRRLARMPEPHQDAARDVDAQTAQMCRNLQTVLGLLEASPDHLARVKLYVDDLRDAARCAQQVQQSLGCAARKVVVVGSHGFPLPRAALEMDALVVEPQTGLPLQACVQAGSLDAGGAPTAAEQAALLALNLARAVAEAGMHTRDVAHLQLTVRDLDDLPLAEVALEAWLQGARPCCSVVEAALPEARMRFQVEAVCHAGGGHAVAADASPAALRWASAAVLAGDTLYLSAQHGVPAVGSGAGHVESVEAQARRAWSRLDALLQACGLSRAHVVSTSNVLTDWRSYAEFNRGYGACVAEPYPPRTTVLGRLPVSGAQVQISAVAHRLATEATILKARHADT